MSFAGAIIVAAAFTLLGGSPAASAFAPCISTDTAVATQEALAEAIDCFNAQTPAGDHTITFDNDITFTAALPPITLADASLELAIAGAGHTLAGPGRDTTTGNVFEHNGAGLLTIDGLAIVGSSAAAVEANAGRVEIMQVTMQDNGTGLAVAGGSVMVSTSTIADNGTGVTLNGGSTLLSNVTVSGAGLEIWDASATATIANSTFGSIDFAVFVVEGSVEIVSTIVGGLCDDFSAPLIDSGSNFSSDPSLACGLENLTPGSLARTLGDNGCVGALCTQTLALASTSNAVENGRCTNVPIGLDATGAVVLGDLDVDQRGIARPASCAAGASEPAPGAFEAELPTCVPDSVAFGQSDLDFAIGCFNAQTPPGDHTITIGASFGVTESLNPVTLDSPGTRLTIAGDGNTLTTDSQDCCDAILALQGSSGLHLEDLVLNDLSGGTTLTVGPNAGDMWVIDSAIIGSVDVEGGSFVLLRSVLRDSMVFGIYATGGTVSVYRSLIVDVNIPIVSSADFLGVGYSIINGTNSDVAVRVEGTQPSQVEILGSVIFGAGQAVELEGSNTTSLIVNSTLWNNDIGVHSVNGDVTVTNSTIALSDIGIQGAGGDVTVTSSILVNDVDCSESFAGTHNFSQFSNCGAGFTQLTGDDFSYFGTIDDHGCDPQTETPWGCTSVLSLLDGHSAIGAGKCDDVRARYNVTGPLEIDQRGVQRVPSSCDAGAFQSSCATSRFSDVAAGLYYSGAVDWAACSGVTTGTSDTTFSPHDTVTRAQLATFLWRYAGEPTGFSHPFTDVASSSYYEDAVAWMAANEITTGTSDTTFSPNDPVTRAQLATFLWRFHGKPVGFSHPFTDVQSPSYYEDGVAWMAQTGITTGTSDTTYSPFSPLTRAQAVTFLWRYNNQQ